MRNEHNEIKSKPEWVLLGVALLFGFYFVKNAIGGFDDFYLPTKFMGMNRAYGVLGTVWTLLSGGDLPSEYRTYAVSRLLQYAIWTVAGASPWPYAIFIVTAQFLSSCALYRVFKALNFSEALALGGALLWFLSPFSINWSFHHYSYALFPWQVCIAVCYVIGAPWKRSERTYHALLGALGVVLALSGELHLVAAPLLVLCFAIAAHGGRWKAAAGAFYVAYFLALGTHWLIWRLCFYDASVAARFEVIVVSDASQMWLRLVSVISSILLSLESQVAEVVKPGFIVGALCGIATAAVFWRACRGESPQAPVSSKNVYGTLFGCLFVSAGLALSIYVSVSVLSGQISEIMPRRYGFGSLSLLVLAAPFFLLWLFGGGENKEKQLVTICIGLVSSISWQLLIIDVALVRARDITVSDSLRFAAQQGATAGGGGKGVLFFMGSDPAYYAAEAGSATRGATWNDLTNTELYGSPFAFYWTAQHYVSGPLALGFAAMPKNLRADGFVEVAGSPYGDYSPAIKPEDVIVLADLSLEAYRSGGANLKTFSNYRQFEPNHFLRSVNRDPLLLGSLALDEVAIDLGRKSGSDATEFIGLPDKSYAEPMGATPKSWFGNYGLVSGEESLFTHPNIGADFAYYRTNRNGDFAYRVDVKDVSLLEVSLDFWEQWGRKAGERVFEAEVSWDGSNWGSVGKIDPAALNGSKPVSIVLQKRNPKLFVLRLKKAEGAVDIPMIQGIRLRRR